MPPRADSGRSGCCRGGGGAGCGVIGSGNVRLAFWFQVCAAVGGSIVQSSVFLSTYIFFLEGAGNANVDVGLVSATAGLTMIALAVPAGVLTDAWPRAAVLRLSGAAGLLSSALLFGALLLPAPRAAMALLYAASALSGAYSALSGPALASILADSVASGQRTRVYALQYAATLAAGAAGPLLGIALLLWLGDAWATPQLRAVMLAGNAVSALACGFAFAFDDGRSLGDESEGALAAPRRAAAKAGANGGGGGGGGGSSGGGGGGDGGGGDDAAAGLLVAEAGASGGADDGVAPAAEEAAESPDEARRRARRNLGHQTLPLGCCTLRVAHVPFVIFASDFTIAVGAGMTGERRRVASRRGAAGWSGASFLWPCLLLRPLISLSLVPTQCNSSRSSSRATRASRPSRSRPSGSRRRCSLPPPRPRPCRSRAAPAARRRPSSATPWVRCVSSASGSARTSRPGPSSSSTSCARRP